MIMNNGHIRADKQEQWNGTDCSLRFHEKLENPNSTPQRSATGPFYFPLTLNFTYHYMN